MNILMDGQNNQGSMGEQQVELIKEIESSLHTTQLESIQSVQETLQPE